MKLIHVDVMTNFHLPVFLDAVSDSCRRGPKGITGAGNSKILGWNRSKMTNVVATTTYLIVGQQEMLTSPFLELTFHS